MKSFGGKKATEDEKLRWKKSFGGKKLSGDTCVGARNDWFLLMILLKVNGVASLPSLRHFDTSTSLSAGELSAGELSAGKLSAGKLSAGKLSAGKLSTSLCSVTVEDRNDGWWDYA